MIDGIRAARAAMRHPGGAVPVFLVSLKSGGFGLNLTEADYCILLDPWWNPATEAQAVDRVHRIGQTRGGEFASNELTAADIRSLLD